MRFRGCGSAGRCRHSTVSQLATTTTLCAAGLLALYLLVPGLPGRPDGSAELAWSARPDTLANTLARSPRFNHFAILAYTNYGMLNMTLNWLISLHNVGVDIRIPLLVCFDHLSYDYLQRLQLNVYLVTNATFAELNMAPMSIAVGLVRFGSHHYKSIVSLKMFISAYVVQVGVPHIFSDVDLVLVRSKPTNAIVDMIERLEAARRLGTAMLIQSDDGADGRKSPFLCTGFYILQPTPDVQALFANATLELLSSDAIGNQVGFNNACVRLDCRTFVDVLDPRLYVRGKDFFLDNKSDAFTVSAVDGPYMLHANWIVGVWKVDNLRAHGLWFIDDPDSVQVLARQPDSRVTLPS